MDKPEEPTLDVATLPPSIRQSIINQLPEDWTPTEIEHFISTYYGKLPETLRVQTIEPGEVVVEEVETDGDTIPVSSASRKGLTLDSYLIVDGRSVSLRAIADAGQLVPARTFVTEGTAKFPRRAVEYTARLIDRPRLLIITEETYKVLSDEFPNVHPHDEPLSAEAVANLQAKVKIVEADKLERKERGFVRPKTVFSGL